MLFRSVSSSHSPAVPHMGPHFTSLSHQCPTAQPSFPGQPHWKYSSQVGATSGLCCSHSAHATSILGGLHSGMLYHLRPSSSHLQWLLQWLCLYLTPVSCLTMPPVCGAQLPVSPHQAHWSPFQGSFLSLTVEGISLFPGGWVTHYRLGSLTHAGLTAASIFPWENIHRLLLSFARLQSWGGIVSVFLPHGPQGAPKEKPVTGSVPYASACNGRQVPWTAA